MVVNYDVLSQDYDLTRSINVDTVQKILSKANIDETSFVLDFGCGTGNYTCAIKKLTGANVFGVEPSDGMREKAQKKGTEIQFVKGDHTSIPFEHDFFDFIYMTDVIHHVPDLRTMFTEFSRVLKPMGMVCILTESHKQIESRFWSEYFPSTVRAEKERYTDICEIISLANGCGFSVDETVITDSEKVFPISSDFVQLVENKGFSMFRFICEEDFEKGLKRLREDYRNKVLIKSNHGETFLWLKSNCLG
jgi:ubiquinone/menaquinone biosynthesis C-methylase UbiE